MLIFREYINNNDHYRYENACVYVDEGLIWCTPDGLHPDDSSMITWQTTDTPGTVIDYMNYNAPIMVADMKIYYKLDTTKKGNFKIIKDLLSI